MEVRLSTTNYQNDAPDSYQLGNSPTDAGSFKTVLKIINDSLKDGGYPRGWTMYEVVISGLPSGRLFNGHVGFWYHYENGGYNNCRSRIQVPPAVSTGLSLAGEIPGPIGEAAGFAENLIVLAQTVDAIGSKNQKGKNGTYIGVDNFEFIPKDEISLRENGTDKIWYKGQGSTPTPMGYKGSPECPSPGKTVPMYIR